MKGLDLEELGSAAMIEALALSFSVDRVTATSLSKACVAYSAMYLQAQLIAEAKKKGQDVGQLETLLADLNNKRPEWAVGLHAAIQKIAAAESEAPK